MAIKIGTRGSSLALAQAECVRELLKERGVKAELKVIKTKGDRFSDSEYIPFENAKDRKQNFGLFVKELDYATLRNEIDISVHSMKDIPTRRPEELEISAMLEREEPFDVFITNEGMKLAEEKKNAVIGTSSIRRKAQLLRFREDLVIKDLRGNINTRLRKLKEREYDGIVIAEVGLRRMKLIEENNSIKGGLYFERLPIEDFIPAPNQGIIAVVAKKGSEEALFLNALDHKKTRIEGYVERKIMSIFGGGCRSPTAISTYAKIEGNILEIMAEVMSKDGRRTTIVKKAFTIDEKQKQASDFKFLDACALETVEELRWNSA